MSVAAFIGFVIVTASLPIFMLLAFHAGYIYGRYRISAYEYYRRGSAGQEHAS